MIIEILGEHCAEGEKWEHSADREIVDHCAEREIGEHCAERVFEGTLFSEGDWGTLC